MRRHLHKFETTFWLVVKVILYLLLLATFIVTMGQQNIGLTRPSRMLAITGTTFVVVGLLFLNVYGTYDVGRRKSRPIIYSLLLAAGCTDIITYIQLMIMRVNNTLTRRFSFTSISFLVLTFLIQMLIIMLFTYAGNWLFFRMHDPEQCCIITDSQESLDEIVFAIQNYKKQYRIASVADYHSKNLQEMIKNVDTVFAFNVPLKYRAEILDWCYEYQVNIYFNPDIEDIIELNAEQYVLDDEMLMNKNVKSLTIGQRIAKRLIDIGLSIILGILSSPFWIGGMIAVKVYDGGPVIYKQERATIHGRRFYVYKIRTMKEDAGMYSVTKDDDRITPPGRFLRRTRIDEIPQLWNVFKGEMSFVGPRPEMISNIETYTEELPEFSYRLRVKAGLTGYAQIAGKYNTTPKDKLIMDMMYIEQFSVMRDLQLIFQTAVVLLRRDSTEPFEDRGHCGYTFEKWEDKDKNQDQES